MRSLITGFFLLILLLVPSTPGLASEAPAEGEATEAPAAPQSGGIGIRLLDIPAATQEDPRAQSYIVDHLPPGTEIQRRVQVENTSDAPQSVRMYAGPARIENGDFVAESDPAENELTTWTSTDPQQVELAPGETADVMVTIAVPQDAAEMEQYGVIWAEVRSAPAEGSNVIQASRVGIRIYLSVGPGNGPPADFTVTSLTASRDAEGNPQVTALVTNTGGRALDVTGELTLTDGPGGVSAGPFAVEQATTIAPGGTGEVPVILNPELPNGPWTATLKLKSGLLEREATAEITFPDAGEAEAVEPVQKAEIPWTPIAVAGVLMLAVSALVVWWLRRRATSTAGQ